MKKNIKIMTAILLVGVMLFGSSICVFANGLLTTKDVKEIKTMFKGYTPDAIPFFVDDAKANGVTLVAFNNGTYDICIYVADGPNNYIIGHTNYVYVEKPSGDYSEIVGDYYDIDMAQLKAIKAQFSK